MSHEVIVRGVCVEDGKILLAFLKTKQYFFLPGGHVEHGESVFDALEREIKEEIGINVMVNDVISVFEHTWSGKNGLVHEINFLVDFTVDPARSLKSLVDHLEFHWVPVIDLKDKIFLPIEIKEQIIAYANGERSMNHFSTSIRKGHRSSLL